MRVLCNKKYHLSIHKTILKRSKENPYLKQGERKTRSFDFNENTICLDRLKALGVLYNLPQGTQVRRCFQMSRSSNLSGKKLGLERDERGSRFERKGEEKSEMKPCLEPIYSSREVTLRSIKQQAQNPPKVGPI